MSKCFVSSVPLSLLYISSSYSRCGSLLVVFCGCLSLSSGWGGAHWGVVVPPLAELKGLSPALLIAPIWLLLIGGGVSGATLAKPLSN